MPGTNFFEAQCSALGLIGNSPLLVTSNFACCNCQMLNNCLLNVFIPGTILLVGHAGSLDTLTRQLSGKKPRERAEFRQFLHKTSYLAINEVIERNNEWKVIGSPIPSLINSGLDRC